MNVETLGSHDLSSFASGAVELDDWLVKRAAKAQDAGDAVVRLAVGKSGNTHGFHALCAGSVERSLAAAPMRRNAPDPIPVLLLARLAVDRQSQGRGVGVALLADAVQRAVAAAAIVGFRALVIHCRDDAALAFYRRWLPISPIPTHPLHVYVPMKRLELERSV